MAKNRKRQRDFVLVMAKGLRVLHGGSMHARDDQIGGGDAASREDNASNLNALRMLDVASFHQALLAKKSK